VTLDVGKRIAAWRASRGWTQQQLADAVGVTHAAVYQWEGTKGHQTTPSLESLEKVVDALGITMERFYGRIPKASKAS
jgi:transcriptional regulator with XRE-family HTH domain